MLIGGERAPAEGEIMQLPDYARYYCNNEIYFYAKCIHMHMHGHKKKLVI